MKSEPMDQAEGGGQGNPFQAPAYDPFSQYELVPDESSLRSDGEEEPPLLSSQFFPMAESPGVPATTAELERKALVKEAQRVSRNDLKIVRLGWW